MLTNRIEMYSPAVPRGSITERSGHHIRDIRYCLIYHRHYAKGREWSLQRRKNNKCNSFITVKKVPTLLFYVETFTFFRMLF